MNTEFEGRTIVVTGGTGGLGHAVTHALVNAGATCVVPCYENRAPSSFELANHERVSLRCGVDLTNEAAAEKLFGEIEGLWASIHVAGGFAMAPVCETSLADFHRMVALNGVTTFLCCREAACAMRRSGGGRIVNVGSRPAFEPTGGMIAYTASKAMVTSMTESLARELIHDNILVNAVVPSTIDTAANRAAMPDADFETWPKPEQIAESIRFLVSPRNTVTSGALLPVYGRA